MANGLSTIGPVMQIAFVPKDFDGALKHWTQTMGVGPFFVMEGITLDGMRYRGAPSDCRFTIAIAYWGDLQVELIRQDNDAPSIYRGDYGRDGDILHHQCVLTDDIAAARRTVEAAGGEVLVEARVGQDGAVLYCDTGGGPGTILEILQPATGTLDLFAMMRAAARDWDGSDPVRRLG
jgi:hypothetical protein